MSRLAPFPFIVLLGLVPAVAACPGALDEPERFHLPVNDCSDVDVPNDIFVARCGTTAGCHTAAAPASDLDLASPDQMMRLKDVAEVGCTRRPLVSSAMPNQSVLLDRLQAQPSCGAPMPLVGDRLSEAEIGCVASWIVETLTGTTSQMLTAEDGS